jgi:NAD(P)-dependent dehydrogenase (short-subunit alcohol dehydrogenase family)
MCSKTNTRPVAIVTGGAGPGVGHGLSEALAADAWDLVIVDRNADRCSEIAERLTEYGTTIEPLVADVTEPGAPEKAVRAALDRFGHFDRLVNNVGVGLVAKAGDVSDEEFIALFNVNLLAPFDRNQRFENVATVHRLIVQLATVDNILCAEDPIARWDLESFALLRLRSQLPLALHR